MIDKKNIFITVETIVKAPIDFVWNSWHAPEAIKKWNIASDDWHTTLVENDLKVGGKFNYRMEAKDGSAGFDFWGIYDTIKQYELLEITLGDNRKMKVAFEAVASDTKIIETFEAENTNPIKLQQDGWQAILNNFNKYVDEKYSNSI